MWFEIATLALLFMIAFLLLALNGYTERVALAVEKIVSEVEAGIEQAIEEVAKTN